MGVEIAFSLLAALISFLIGGLLPLFRSVLKPQLIKRIKENPNDYGAKRLARIFSIRLDESRISYQDRVTKTLETLKKVSIEMEKATVEFNAIMKEKQGTIEELETKLIELSSKESELTTKIETLQKIPIEALSHFEKILNKGSKRSAYRDYILFGIGVIVSVIVTIVLKRIGY